MPVWAEEDLETGQGKNWSSTALAGPVRVWRCKRVRRSWRWGHRMIAAARAFGLRCRSLWCGHGPFCRCSQDQSSRPRTRLVHHLLWQCELSHLQSRMPHIGSQSSAAARHKAYGSASRQLAHEGGGGGAGYYSDLAEDVGLED